MNLLLKNKTGGSSLVKTPSKDGSINYYSMTGKGGSAYLNAPVFSGSSVINQHIRPEESYIHQLAPSYNPSHVFG